MAKISLTALSIVKQGADKRGPGGWTLSFRPEGLMGYHMHNIEAGVAEKVFDAVQKVLDLESLPKKDRLYSAHDSREHAAQMEKQYGIGPAAVAARAEDRLTAARERNERAREANNAARGVEVAE